MQQMLEQQVFHTPVTLPDPVFEIEFRRLHWPRTDEEFKRYGTSILFGLCIAVGLLAILSYRLPREQTLSAAAYLFLLVNIGITVASDLHCMMTTVDRTSFQIAAGQWEALQLTTLSHEKIVYAKYAIAQIRARRLMIVSIVLRILPVFYIALLGLIDVIVRGNLLMILLWPMFTLIMGTLLSPLLLYLWVFEPVWQMQTFVAMAILLSLQIRHQTFATLAGFAAIFVLRTLQLVFLAFVIWASLTILQWLASTGGVFCTVGLLYLTIPPLAIYGFHKLIRDTTLHWAVRRIFHSN
ncbi:MAG: hypothetical protein ABI947_21090 [Chloroflexota bacterium]